MTFYARTLFNDDCAESGAAVLNQKDEIQAVIRFSDTLYGDDGNLARNLAIDVMKYMADKMNEKTNESSQG